MREYLNNLLRVSSRLLNVAVLNGYATETISGRAWFEGWWITVWLLDNIWLWFGEKDHCYNSWIIDTFHKDARP